MDYWAWPEFFKKNGYLCLVCKRHWNNFPVKRSSIEFLEIEQMGNNLERKVNGNFHELIQLVRYSLFSCSLLDYIHEAKYLLFHSWEVWCRFSGCYQGHAAPLRKGGQRRTWAQFPSGDKEEPFWGKDSFSSESNQLLVVMTLLTLTSWGLKSNFRPARCSAICHSLTALWSSLLSGSTNRKAVIFVPPYLNSSKSTPCRSWKPTQHHATVKLRGGILGLGGPP